MSRCLAENIPLHRSAGQSADKRRRKKLLARTQWFRSPGQDEEADDETHSHTTQGAERHGGGQGKNSKKEYNPEQKELRTSTVLFVEFSKGGNLEKHIREGLERITPVLSFKVRVTEKGGTPLGSLLSNKNLWSAEQCGRENCRTCAQPGERKEPCTLRNIVYESECTSCNPPVTRKEGDKSSLEDKREQASLYVGESAR